MSFYFYLHLIYWGSDATVAARIEASEGAGQMIPKWCHLPQPLMQLTIRFKIKSCSLRWKICESSGDYPTWNGLQVLSIDDLPSRCWPLPVWRHCAQHANTTLFESSKEKKWKLMFLKTFAVSISSLTKHVKPFVLYAICDYLYGTRHQ